MKRSTRLAPVLKYEHLKEDRAVRAWNDGRMRLFQEQQKLQQLEDYVLGYQDSVSQEMQQATSAVRIQTYHAFIGRLNFAVEQQRQQVALVTEEIRQLEQNWRKQYGARKGMESLVDRYQMDERREADRLEQKEQDELARPLLFI